MSKWQNDALAQKIAAWVRGYRLIHDLTQAELAQKLGSTQAIVARMESGTLTPSLASVARLADQLELETSLTFWKGGYDLRLTPSIESFRTTLAKRAAKAKKPLTRRGPQHKSF